MAFTVTVFCTNRVDRDAALGFMRRVDWQALGQEDPTWAGLNPVGGRQLLYAPNYRTELMLGFNVEKVTDLVLATGAWLATRLETKHDWRPALFVDRTPIALAFPGQRRRPEKGALPTDENGVLTFSHQSLLDRGLSVLEHTSIRQVLTELSAEWPLGSLGPLSVPPRRGPSY